MGRLAVVVVLALVGMGAGGGTLAEEVPPQLYQVLCAGKGGFGDTPRCRECLSQAYAVLEGCAAECKRRAAGDEAKQDACLQGCAERQYASVGSCVKGKPAKP